MKQLLIELSNLTYLRLNLKSRSANALVIHLFETQLRGRQQARRCGGSGDGKLLSEEETLPHVKVNCAAFRWA